MKFKVVVVDLELSRREKRALGGGIAACVLAGAAIAYASVPTVWSDGDVLTASDLNGNFSNLDGRTTTLENARTTDEQTIASQGTSIANLTTEVHSDESTVSSGFTQRLAAGASSVGSYFGNAVNPQTTQTIWQGDTSVIVVDSNGTGSINFPSPFPNGVVTIVATNGDPQNFFGNVIAANTSSFTFQAYVTDGSGPPPAGRMVRVNWIAIGW